MKISHSSTSKYYIYLITGIALGISVFGIYGYSMYAVKQEKFLDDFEIPLTEEIPQSQEQ